MSRAITPVLLALVLASPLAAQDGPGGPAGRYDFATTSDDGDPLTGTIHLTRIEGRYGGRVLTTLRPPFPILRAEVTSSGRLVVVGDLGRGRSLTFELTRTGDSISGRWTLGSATGVVRGTRVASAGHDLPPVACRMPGVEDVIRCATRYVPEDRAAPEGRRIPINVVVLPATGPAAERAPDPLVHFAGGPGQASTEQAGGNARRFAAIRRRRDVVLVDQRGTGESNGLQCELRGAETRVLVLMAGGFAAADFPACAEALGARADLRRYTTTRAADDLEDVRRFLGYERLNLYGGSYGTRAALAYLRRHPTRVRTITLRAVEAPSGILGIDNPKDAEASLARVFRECEADSACAAAFPEVRQEFSGLLRDLERAPARLAVHDPETGDTVRVSVTRQVFAGGVRRMLMDADALRSLPYVVHRAASGDWEPFAPAVRATLGVARSLYLGMSLSVGCAEDYQRLRRRNPERETAGTFLGPAMARAFLATCPEWPHEPEPPGFDRPVRSDVPALLLSGVYDPATPARWGEEVARTLSRSLHLVMEGVSHAPFPDCAVAIMTAFVEAGAVAGLDTGCVAALSRGPFVVRGDGT